MTRSHVWCMSNVWDELPVEQSRRCSHIRGCTMRRLHMRHVFFFKIAVSFHQVDVPQFKHGQSIWKTETNLFCNRQTLASYITNYRTPIFHTLSTYKEIRHVNIRTMNKEKSVTIVHCFYIARHWSKILISKKNSTSLKRMRSANFTQPYKQFDFYI